MATNDKQRKPRGRAKVWTPDEIARMAEVTPDNIRAAGRMWKQDAPAPLKGLLEAEPVTEE